MQLAAALEYLDSHVNLEARAGRIEGLSLDKMRRLVEVLGDPERAYRSIHVTGTNGKGSVARMISALLVEHGLSVGTYSSPHLQRVNERMCWNLEPIDDDSLAELLTEMARVEPLAGVEASYFELVTAAALSWFAEIAVDVAVVEVGLLGRFDATNVVDADVAVITNIGRDHTDGVGDWRAKVAREKAGIIKKGSTVVLGETDPGIRTIFEDEVVGADALGLWMAEHDFALAGDRVAVGGRSVDLRTPGGELDELFLPVYGRHQAENASMALAATEAFFGRATERDVVEAALSNLTIPGRFEIVGRSPLVILDGAHNPPGAAAVAATLDEGFDVSEHRIFVVGMLEGRDPVEILDALEVRGADLVVACSPPSARAMSAQHVAAAAEALGADIEVVDEVPAALQRALDVAGEEDLVLVTGSLYVVGCVREALGLG